MRNLFRKNGVAILANGVLLLIVISAFMVVHNSAIIMQAKQQQELVGSTMDKSDLF